MRNLSGSGLGDYPLLAAPNKQPSSTEKKANDSPSSDSEHPDVIPPRPTPPTVPVPSRKAPSTSSVCITQCMTRPVGS